MSVLQSDSLGFFPKALQYSYHSVVLLVKLCKCSEIRGFKQMLVSLYFLELLQYSDLNSNLDWISNLLRTARFEFTKKNDQKTPFIAVFQIHVRVSTKIMGDCFENCEGLVSSAKLGPADGLETANDKYKQDTCKCQLINHVKIKLTTKGFQLQVATVKEGCRTQTSTP